MDEMQLLRAKTPATQLSATMREHHLAQCIRQLMHPENILICIPAARNSRVNQSHVHRAN